MEIILEIWMPMKKMSNRTNKVVQEKMYSIVILDKQNPNMMTKKNRTHRKRRSKWMMMMK